MELVSFAKEMLQSVAEWAASYRLGQTALRHADRALWVVEKCARWAVPPPLDQDDRPQPELVRPLPWIFFLVLLITLRITRESISLINLLMGKPPLRSADVVMYIQSKRRYLRTLKYQGNRMMRARTASEPPQRTWYSRVQALFEFTMCFRNSHNYGNNNTTHVSNNDEVLVVKRNKRRNTSGAASAETTMDRLIEKMMQDLAADSDEDSSFTLTNVTSIRSDRSDTPESDQDTILHHEVSTPQESKTSDPDSSGASNEIETVPDTNELHRENSSTNKQDEGDVEDVEVQYQKQDSSEKVLEKQETNEKENDLNQEISATAEKMETNTVLVSEEDAALQSSIPNPPRSPIEDTQMLLQHERCSTQQSPNNDRKNVNGQIVITPSKKKGLNSDLQESDQNNKSM